MQMLSKGLRELPRHASGIQGALASMDNRMAIVPFVTVSNILELNIILSQNEPGQFYI